MIQQQGSNYLERGQEFVKSRMGFINSSSLHYHFNVDTEYGKAPRLFLYTSMQHKTDLADNWHAVRSKLLMLLVPFLKRWTYTRAREQVLCLST